VSELLPCGDGRDARFPFNVHGVHVGRDHAVIADDEQKLDELVFFVAVGERAQVESDSWLPLVSSSAARSGSASSGLHWWPGSATARASSRSRPAASPSRTWWPK
jgi:hypothetical protein